MTINAPLLAEATGTLSMGDVLVDGEATALQEAESGGTSDTVFARFDGVTDGLVEGEDLDIDAYIHLDAFNDDEDGNGGNLAVNATLTAKPNIRCNWSMSHSPGGSSKIGARP